ncbi:MAG: Na+/H+ antiporter NhaC [Gemmatimonadota bacterium]|jgi:NhaC family Na+:H+ antiporter
MSGPDAGEATPDTSRGPTPRAPTLGEALLPLGAAALLLALGYAWQGWRIEVMLLAAAGVAGAVGWRLGHDWSSMEKGVIEALSTALPAVFILITVGALIGSWIAAGTIPLLVSWGLDLMSPRFFLVTTCVICSLVSVFTGTSWGTAGTVGVALMGVAAGLGVSPGAAAGAVVSGAYFGDKLSPFSDTTNLAPVVARSNLFDHIRWLLWTTAPAWTLGLGVYLLVGLGEPGGASSDVATIQAALAGAFRFHWLLLAPPLVMLGFAVRGAPILPGMLLSTLTAVVLAVWLQGDGVAEVLEATVSGYVPATGVESVDGLLARGGMLSMMDLVLLILCAFGFAGILRRCGMLDRILEAVLGVVRGTFGLVAGTAAAGVLTAVVTGSSYLSIIVPGELFQDAFRRADLAAKNLSRTLEDSGTVVVPLVPWSAAGTFMAGTLGVPTVSYLPWAVMNWTGVLVALTLAATGVGIAPRVREDETRPGS